MNTEMAAFCSSENKNYASVLFARAIALPVARGWVVAREKLKANHPK